MSHVSSLRNLLFKFVLNTAISHYTSIYSFTGISKLCYNNSPPANYFCSDCWLPWRTTYSKTILFFTEDYSANLVTVNDVTAWWVNPPLLMLASSQTPIHSFILKVEENYELNDFMMEHNPLKQNDRMQFRLQKWRDLDQKGTSLTMPSTKEKTRIHSYVWYFTSKDSEPDLSQFGEQESWLLQSSKSH